tara:strand:- start:987 stop:1244 length:258 start_codon:yes stop_codon:yes gene_type:complete
MTEQEYLLARGALDGLHKIYRFACVDRMVPMPRHATREKRRLGDICRAYAREQWAQVPDNTKVWCYRQATKAKATRKYLEAINKL